MKKATRLLIPVFGCLLNTVGDVQAQQAMTPRDMENLKNQVQKCWAIPAGTPTGRVHVDVKVKLKSDGTLDGAPKLLNESQDSKLQEGSWIGYPCVCPLPAVQASCFVL